MNQTAHKLTRLLLAFAIMCLPFFSHAQSIQVKGKITDAATEKPIDGATIMVKNAKGGTSSNMAGEFSISANKGEKLTITIVGFESQTVTAAANFLNIQLQADNRQLNEVVVTALGVKKEVKKNWILRSGSERIRSVKSS